MRLLASACLVVAAAAAPAAPMPYFAVLSQDAGAWPAILSSIGLERQPVGLARIFVAREGAAASAEWNGRVERGAILILEGESSLAEMFGFRKSDENVKVNSLIDSHRPSLPLIWAKGLELPVTRIPEGSRTFAWERWTKAPMMAGFRRGAGAVLWVAVPPGERGYERFPYLLNALRELGLEAPFRSARLWAFFDSAYRSRVDLDYFAARWRKSGIAALQVAAWHFYDPDPEQDAYLRRLIEACHRQGILVYAWLELPHVSEKFWNDHPEWREKTGLLQDAQLDWRKLMNLANRDCDQAVAEGVQRLIGAFDWDGVNLAELYFESLEGIGNPSRFTPMNPEVRGEFQRLHGWDPIELFGGKATAADRSAFLEYRAELAERIEREWLGRLEEARRRKPYLDLVLTHVDDQFDRGIRDAIGADASRMLPLLDTHSFTFLIEDPATVWNLGPQRYPAIAQRYGALTPHRDRLAIDLNIVERYQDVYPTKQQTGTELYELVHMAAGSFARVALYLESSLESPDLDLVASAGASVSRFERIGNKVGIVSEGGVGIPWEGGAKVDGALWPVADAGVLWVPAGSHSIEPAERPGGPMLLRFTGDLKSAGVVGAGKITFAYESRARAFGILNCVPKSVEVDGATVAAPFTPVLALPRGQHVVTISAN